MKYQSVITSPVQVQSSVPRKRRRDDCNDDSPDTAAKRLATKISFRDADSIREQARPFRLVIARLPIYALDLTFSTGLNRRLDIQHAQNFCSMFKQGSLNRRAEENRLRVLYSSAEVKNMLDYLKTLGKPDDRDDRSIPASDKELCFTD